MDMKKSSIQWSYNRIFIIQMLLYNFFQGKFIPRKWEEIHVGDICRVQNEKPFPADLVLLASSEPDGMCFIETANLDGETNLKIRNAIAATCNVFTERIEEQAGVLNCELPNR